MAGCTFCDRPAEGDTAHEECAAEFRRRDEAGLCLGCGKTERDEYVFCPECRADEATPYHGYPPGGA